MTCGGEGGMVVTDDPDLAYRCRLYANHGRGRNWAVEQDAEVIGLNYRLSEILAAIGRVQLRHLDDWNHQRRVNAAVYEELFAGRDLPVTLPPEPEWGYHTRMRYPSASRTATRLRTICRRLASKQVRNTPCPSTSTGHMSRSTGSSEAIFPSPSRRPMRSW